jgi:hypothetical protein
MATDWSTAGNAGIAAATEFLGTTDAEPLVVRTNNAERIRVNPEGGVGIAAPGIAGVLQLGFDSGGISLSWAAGSVLTNDQGGSIELIGPGTPHIDFHFKGPAEDYNVRIINDADSQLSFDANIVRVPATFLWAGGSSLTTDQGGSIELMGPGTPHIDFHLKGAAEDYNVRVINDADGQMTLVAKTVRVAGSLSLDGQDIGAVLNSLAAQIQGLHDDIGMLQGQISQLQGQISQLQGEVSQLQHP